MELYPSEGIPYTILIDKSGRVYKTFLGARSAEEQYEVYRSAIEEAMNEEKSCDSYHFAAACCGMDRAGGGHRGVQGSVSKGCYDLLRMCRDRMRR